MMPLTGKERRKYLVALKEKNAVGEHIVSDPAGLQLRRGKRDHSAASETPEDDVMAAGSSGQGAADDIIDMAASPQRKKARTGRKDAEKSEKQEGDAVAEVDAAYRQSFWHRDFQYRWYMEENFPFAAVDDDASFHAKFSDLAQDAGTSSLRSLVYIHSMKRKYDSLEKQFQDAVKDVEKYMHKVAAFEERVEGLLLDKTKVEKVVSDLEKEKAGWMTERGELVTKAGDLEKELSSTKEVVEDCKMALIRQFEDGFDRAKSQVAFLYPDLDLSALDSLKIVQEGELIDEP